MVVKVHAPAIDLRKSPLSGSQITTADMRRRSYKAKCDRTSSLASLFNDESLGLNLDLWDTRPSFEARGAQLICNWSNVREQDMRLCDLVIARIRREIDTDSAFYYESTKAYLERKHEFEVLLERVLSIKYEVLRESLYGKKCG